MKCPYCGHEEDKVIDSRVAKDGSSIRRRRQCVKCNKRFTTYEQVEETHPVVVKRDGHRERFDRMKILSGLQKACEKRPVSAKALEGIIHSIEQAILDRGKREVSSQEIGELIMQHLHDTDEVAYVRFASVYRQFRDVGEFVEEIHRVLKRGPGSPPKADSRRDGWANSKS